MGKQVLVQVAVGGSPVPGPSQAAEAQGLAAQHEMVRERTDRREPCPEAGRDCLVAQSGGLLARAAVVRQQRGQDPTVRCVKALGVVGMTDHPGDLPCLCHFSELKV